MKTSTLLPIALALSTATASAQSPIQVRFEGTVSQVFSTVSLGAFAGIQAGDSWSFDFEVFTPGFPTGTGDRFEYDINSSTAVVESVSGTEGIEQSSNPRLQVEGGQISVLNALFTTNSGVSIASQLFATSAPFPLATSDLLLLTGIYPGTAFNINSGNGTEPSPSTGRFQLEVTQVIIGDLTLGTNYCDANANTTGAAASISAMGSAVAASNDLTLVADALPVNSFGFFLTSTTTAFVANPGGSAGNLCLANPIGRYVGPGQIQQTNQAGQFSLAIDLAQTPTPLGFVSIGAGDIYAFQAWFRDVDPVSGLATSNFTDGLEVNFE